ncbi:diglucosylglycerate octanoyltransferase [Amycolatopsis sp. NPDC049253]|uniref:diglucosylglycerate octanoyltransferase n=1 Tax=Amycolatopsis sp. NPDC049253 TaxID=3155274 RepID=UPI0034247CE8
MGSHLLVFGDSLSFHGPEGPCAADEPRLWPNVAATALDGRADVVAGIGWTARDVWWSLTGDPRVWADLHHVDAVVLAIGSMDTLPSPLPTYLRTGLRYLRPDGVRRIVRGAYLAAQPRLSVVLRGRPAVLPAKLTVHYLDLAVEALRVLRPELPIFGMLPSVHRADAYGRVHTARPAAAAAMAAWGARLDVPLLDLPSVVGDHVLGGEGNPDGMHWGWAGHEAVGTAMAKLMTPALRPGHVG